jgi:endonuclease YncB( thermonuclease family)
MLGWRDWIAAAALAATVAACATVGASAQQQQTAAPACGGDEIARATVKSIIDGRTFTLADGREVRLAAIEVPPLPAPSGSGQQSGAVPGGAAARAALDALAGGDDVVLRRAQAAPDRYGRVVAFVYTERDGDELFVQGELLASGFARVGDLVAGRACAATLFARENAARKGKLGLWADPYYDLLDAETPADVLAHKGQFALVEGQVVSVRESGTTIYVNFGRRWSDEFAVTVRKRNERTFAAAGLVLKDLSGRRVVVRGFIEARGARGSPSIEATRPEQIEIADSN